MGDPAITRQYKVNIYTDLIRAEGESENWDRLINSTTTTTTSATTHPPTRTAALRPLPPAPHRLENGRAEPRVVARQCVRVAKEMD